MEFAVGQIPFEGLSAWGAKDFVVLTPGDQQRRLMSPEVRLALRVPVEVELIIPKQLQLNGIVALAVESGLITLPRIGGNAVEPVLGHSVLVLPLRSLEGEVLAHGRFVFGRAVFGVSDQSVPKRATEPLHVGVTALGN